MKTLTLLPALALFFLGGLTHASAQGTEFTYQGRLHDGVNPANGTYEIAFRPFGVSTGGSPLTIPVLRILPVTNGLFTTTMDFGASLLDGNPRYLQLEVRTNGGAGFTILMPRQQLTPVPYSIYSTQAGTVPAGSIDASKLSANAVATAALQNNSVLGGKIANGQVVRNVNGLQDSVTLAAGTNTTITSSGNTLTITGSSDWKLGGNAGITSGTNFLGTTDTNALELKVNNQRGLRLEPTANTDTVNVIGGSARNSVRAGVVGATIGGGGSGNYFGDTYTNRVESDFGTISGGIQNTIQPFAEPATIGGGYLNTIETNASFATIGGGYQNTIQTNAYEATIGGGYLNMIRPDAFAATIGGGGGNTIQTNATYATIPGGRENRATDYAFAAGQRAKAIHTGAFVWADATEADFTSTANNQFLIRATGGVGINKTNPVTALDVNGTVTATRFSGNGAGVTNLNATNLVGTISNARLSTNVALRTGGNAFSGTQTISGGSLGIGTTAPTKSLEVQGAGDVEIGLKSTDLNGRLWTLQSSGNGTPGREQTFQIIDRTAGASRMLINPNGNVGIGTPQPSARLSVVAPGASELGGTARSATLLTSAGDLGTVAGNELALATLGFASANSSSLGIRALRVADGAGWPDTAIGLGMDVDNTVRAGASLWLHANGNVGIGTTSPSTKLEVNGTVSASSDVTEGFVVRGAAAGYALYDRLPGHVDNRWSMFASGGTLGFYNANPGGIVMSVSPSGDVTARRFNGMAGTPLTLGTTDNQPLEFRVNNQRALQLEPAGSNSVNVIGGWSGNAVAPGVVGATVVGGGAGDFFGLAYTNRVDANFGTVSGGERNTIQIGAYNSTIGGGGENMIENFASDATIGGGSGNTIQIGAYNSTIGGGFQNKIQIGALSGTIGGGEDNTIQNSAEKANIGGGWVNTIWFYAQCATIGGGIANQIQDFAENATIGGGSGNQILANADSATIGGGSGNTIGGSADYATIGGGSGNTIQDGAACATIPGGLGNSATNFAFAAGTRAKANHIGAFVWADSTDADMQSTTGNSVTMRASGGYRLFSNLEANAGVSLAPGGIAWGVISDRNVKKDFAPVDQHTILKKLAALPITQWHYAWESPDVTPHIGPMAQDFKAAFYPGTDDKTITTQEADGVALAAIQGLNQKVEGEVTALRTENAELKQRLEKLEQLMSREDGGAR